MHNGDGVVVLVPSWHDRSPPVRRFIRWTRLPSMHRKVQQNRFFVLDSRSDAGLWSTTWPLLWKSILIIFFLALCFMPSKSDRLESSRFTFTLLQSVYGCNIRLIFFKIIFYYLLFARRHPLVDWKRLMMPLKLWSVYTLLYANHTHNTRLSLSNSYPSIFLNIYSICIILFYKSMKSKREL